ncbi:MAG: LuxR C-terminal-related transcriptional regulator, partial [Chloroflexota bacterium]
MVNQTNQEAYMNNLDSLTVREREIIELMQAGLSNKEIANQMSLAYETIKWYCKRIYGKVGVKNRNQLISSLNSLPRPHTSALAESTGTWKAPLTAFIGRMAEKETLFKQIKASRLVSIVGPGGNGKTRLALEIGRVALKELGRNPYLISAEAFQSEEELIYGLAKLFSISLNHFDSPINQIGAGIPKAPSLLIIDNFESIIESAPLLNTLLKQSEELKVLVTSRTVLGLNSESIYQLDGLAQSDLSSEENDAAHLFKARAHLNHEDTADQIAQICNLVGGSPLAIELAASWTRSLTCKQILAELNEGLAILSSTA